MIVLDNKLFELLFLIVLTWISPTSGSPVSNSSQEVLTVVEGNIFALNCGGKGNHLAWFKNKGDKKIIVAVGTTQMTYEYANRLHLIEDQLTISNARVEDSGTFICESFPDEGLGQKTFLVNVTSKDSDQLPPGSVKLNVPQFVKLGEPTRLECNYNLGGEVLYSLKWFKDNIEFYRYTPRDSPKSMKFQVTGITVNMTQSNATSLLVTLTMLNRQSFVCAVSADAPTFSDFSDTRYTTVVLDQPGALMANAHGSNITATPATPTPEGNSTSLLPTADVSLSKWESLLEYQNSILKRQLEITETEHQLNKQLIPLQIDYYRRLLGMTPTTPPN